jgi:hypothetical protein
MTPLTVNLTPQTLRKWERDAEATRPSPFIKRVPPPAVGADTAKQAQETK